MTKPASRIAFSEKALAERIRGARVHALTSVRARWTWGLFAVVTACFVSLSCWGFLGSIVSSVSGQGMLLLRGGVRPVVAQASGVLTQLNIRMGTPVSRVQVIGQIQNAEILFKMRKLEIEYEQLCRESDALIAGFKEMTDLRLVLEREREAALVTLTEKYDESLSRNWQISRSYGELKGMGAVSMAEYFSSLDNMLSTEAQLLSSRLEVLLSSGHMREADWEQRKTLINLESQRLLKALEVELAHKLFRDSFWLTAGFDGHILELLKREGEFIRQGDNIALIAADMSQGLYLVGYFPVDAGKKVKTGMSAYFAPATGKNNENGFIVGVVREVSEAPVAPEAVFAELHNSGLTQVFTGGGAVMRVAVELIPDETTVSGLKWTSRTGANMSISNGTPGTLIVNTEYRKPASYLVPYARSVLFGE